MKSKKEQKKVIVDVRKKGREESRGKKEMWRMSCQKLMYNNNKCIFSLAVKK